MVRMDEKQYKAASGLISDTCCNYDPPTKSCLLLDNGEPVQCPQTITRSLICRYFRGVLLEDPDNRELKAALLGTERTYRKVCGRCGKPFRTASNRAKYCPECAGQMKRTQARERKRRQRELNVTL